MERDFWHERWQNQQIGFHQHDINPYLARFWPDLQVPAGAAVFVPLCGKSRDMVWLRERGHEVIGVELSPLAVEAFFAENGLAHEVSRQDNFTVYRSEGVRIYLGDFFELAAAQLAGVKAVFDRAALIALPPEMRAAYAQHLLAILPARARGLLVAFEYPQHQMQGPPFSVEESEVRTLFGATGAVRLLHDADILASESRFRERGVTRLHEKVYALAYNAVSA